MDVVYEYTLTRAYAVRKPHVGLVVNAYYKRDPLNQSEKELHVTVFNRWPNVKIKVTHFGSPFSAINHALEIEEKYRELEQRRKQQGIGSAK